MEAVFICDRTRKGSFHSDEMVRDSFSNPTSLFCSRGEKHFVRFFFFFRVFFFPSNADPTICVNTVNN